jgi:hypothetical protein
MKMSSFFYQVLQVMEQQWNEIDRGKPTCQILIKLEFSRQIIENYSNCKLLENQSSGNRVVPYGWTDRQTDMAKVIVFCEST